MWLRVSGCDIDYLGAGYRESKGQISELFFPIRPPAQARTTPAALVVATSDSDVLAVAQSTIGGGRQPDQEAFLVMMLRIVTMLKVSREVEGYARSGVMELLRTRRALTGLNAPLAPEVLVLDLHARPSFLLPGIEAGAGLFLLALSLTLLRRRSRGRAKARSSRRRTRPCWPARDRAGCPGLMLLNLDPEADLGAVEHAAPLGSRGEVERRIAEVLPGFRVDPAGLGTWRGEDWSLALHLGGEENVWTVTVDVRGDESIDALDALVAATGWRVFAPKLGVFVTPSSMRLVNAR